MDKPTEHPSEMTREQKDRLLTLAAELVDSRPDENWPQKLNEKLRTDFGIRKWSGLNRQQLDEMLAYLEAELDPLGSRLHAGRRVSGRARTYEHAVLVALRAARDDLPSREWRDLLDDLTDLVAAEQAKLLREDDLGKAT